MKNLAVAFAVLCLAPAMSSAEVPANADTVEAYGLTLIGGIDKFIYGPHELVQPTLLIINSGDVAVTIPGATSFCTMRFIEETWCLPDSSGCIDYGETGECPVNAAFPIQPGTFTASVFGDRWGPSAGSWIHTSGRVRFWDPWGSPWANGSAFELSVSFQRSPIVAVQPLEWGRVKGLYR